MENKEKIVGLDNKLQYIKKEICIMQKDQEGFGYKYVSEESILLRLNELMLELNLRLIPSIIATSLENKPITYKDKKGNECNDTIVQAEMKFIWKDIDSGEVEEVYWGLFGQQSDASQAFGSGLTYSNRYFLLKYFNIATSKDDPDKIRSEQQKEQEEKELRSKMSAAQTKIKKLFVECVTKLGGSSKVYEVMGTSKDGFTKDFNDISKQDNLIEQMKLILESDKDA